MAKPDSHLTRLAESLGFSDAHSLCDLIALTVNERVGVVDLVLWRASVLGWQYGGAKSGPGDAVTPAVGPGGAVPASPLAADAAKARPGP